jgi:hypothetical protein
LILKAEIPTLGRRNFQNHEITREGGNISQAQSRNSNVASKLEVEANIPRSRSLYNITKPENTEGAKHLCTSSKVNTNTSAEPAEFIVSYCPYHINSSSRHQRSSTSKYFDIL